MEEISVLARRLETEGFRVQELGFDGKKMFTAVKETDTDFEVEILCGESGMTLHWGLGMKRSKEWLCPSSISELSLPSGTVRFDEKASQTPMGSSGTSTSKLTFKVPKNLGAKQVNFVLKCGDRWFNNNRNDFAAPLEEPTGSDLNSEWADMVSTIIEVETNGRSWTLMHRFNLCNQLLRRAQHNPEALAWIFVWMRYSSMRFLTWQRSYNTKPTELASSQKNLTYAVAELAKSAQGFPSLFLRGVLAGIGKGGDHGQKIRDQILVIMHRHGIKEHGNYYEQWHQKLHNNTTPDDIGICEATIAFNETNDMGRFWAVLAEHNISRERLASFERPITMEPFYAPQLIGDLRDYLQILKSVHQAADLQTSVGHARHMMQGSLGGAMDDVMHHLHHWDKLQQFRRVVQVRQQLAPMLRGGDLHVVREMFYVDITLDSYSKSLVESIIHLDIGLDNLFAEIFLLLESVALTLSGERFAAVRHDLGVFYEVYRPSFHGNREHALMVKAATDRLYAELGCFSNEYMGLVDEKARMLGGHFEVDDFFASMFAEEAIRGTLVMTLSLVLKKLNSDLRVVAGLKPWQTISSRQDTVGVLEVVDSLATVAYKQYTRDTVLIAKKVSGDEEVPAGVVGVISQSDLDSLAHVSVRARNGQVLLVVCYEEAALAHAFELVGSLVQVKATSDGYQVVRTTRSDRQASSVSSTACAPAEIIEPDALEDLIITSESFHERKVGAKALNCALMREKLEGRVRVPQSVALPYGCCEYFLGLPVNAELSNRLDRLMAEPTKNEKKLSEMREIILKLQAPNSDKETLVQGLRAVGFKNEQWDNTWKAIKSVWASKFNERVYISTGKAGIKMRDIVMSVLCQPIVDGEYAYVLHTKNPFNDNTDEIYGELVLGMGETLVGAYDGKALSFVVSKKTKKIEVLGFCSKTVVLKNSGVICRSDSNSEDLPGFAGAGLFDSFPVANNVEVVPRYADEPIVRDVNFRNNMILKLREVGIQVEEAFDGVPQDIEGVISGQQAYVVQARPQV